MSQSRALKAEIDRLLALTPDYSHVELAAAWGGVTASLVGKLRGGWRPGRMDVHRLEAMRRLLQQLEAVEVATTSKGRSVAEAPPAPTFVEHVLFTAGRIAELANQIASAAAQQQRVSYELGERAEREGRRPAPPSGPSPSHGPPRVPSAKGARAKKRPGKGGAGERSA